MAVALLRDLHHVVDRLLDEVVGHVGATALGGHDSSAAGEAADGVVIEDRLALGDPGAPGCLVARAGCSGDPLTVAGAARLLEKLGAILRNRHLRGAMRVATFLA